jgi:hypothetical protein
MGKLSLGIVALMVVFGSDSLAAQEAAQQCITFSRELPCAPKKGAIDRIDFRVSKPAPEPQSPNPVVTPGKELNPPHAAIDCAMVKPIDPNFHSAMPIVKPHPNVQYTLRVIPVPTCR